MNSQDQRLLLQEEQGPRMSSDSGEDSEDGPGKQQHQQPFGHYRRKKTNKAPRKRTFIANMTKSPEKRSATLESAARGVGVGGAGNHALGLGASNSLLPTGEPGGRAPAGGSQFATAPSFFPSGQHSSQFAHLAAASAQQLLPWDLASLPTLGEPVVWGTKQLSGMDIDRAPQRGPRDTAGPFTELLNGPFTSDHFNMQESMFPNWSEIVAATNRMSPGRAAAAQDEYDAVVAAAAAAAAMVVSGSAVSSPSSTSVLSGASSGQHQVQAPAGPPKVSFDLFPELAALAGGSAAAQMGHDVSSSVMAAPALACFSRAVVTGVEGSRGMAGMMAFAAAPAPMQASPPAASAMATTSTMSATTQQQQQQQQQQLASAASLDRQRQQLQQHHQQQAAYHQAAATAAGMQVDSAMAAAVSSADASASNGRDGSWPSSQTSLQTSSRSMSSSGTIATVAGRGLAGNMQVNTQQHQQVGQLYQLPSMQPNGSGALVRSASGVFTVERSQSMMLNQPSITQLPAQYAAAHGALPPAISDPEAAMQLPAAAGGRGGGRRAGAGAAAGRGRGTKRGAAAAALLAGNAVQPAAAGAAAAAAWAAAAAAGSNGSAQGTPRSPPFVIPLHGMSLAGAVVPGGAGELRVNTLVSVGAYGLVYRGRWGDRDVAVKTMRTPQPGEGLSASDVLRSFRHEADLLTRIAHANIVAVKHSQDVEPVCIVQDYATHGTLSDYIHSSVSSTPFGNNGAGGLPPASDLERAVLRRLARRLALAPDALIADLEARSVATTMLPQGGAGGPAAVAHPNQRLLRRYVVLLCLLRDVASAFVYLAAPPGQSLPPIVHRDVKPANILLSMQGTALLADFGVAQLMKSNSDSTPAASRLTPAASAPAPASTGPAAAAPLPGSELVSMFNVWSDDMASWGLSGAPVTAKRARTSETASIGSTPAASSAALAAGGPTTWDPMPSADVDLSWLDALLSGNEDETGERSAAQASAPAMAMPSNNASNTSAAAAVTTGSAGAAAGAANGQQSGGRSSSWPNHHGTAHYAAPEDLCDNGYPLTPAADMFSFGYCIWEALTASRPWAGKPSSAVAMGVGRNGVRLPLPTSWPPRLAALVRRCWASDPSLRPGPGQVLAELDAEIRQALGGSL